MTRSLAPNVPTDTPISHPSSATPMQQQAIAPSGDAQDWEEVAKVLKGKEVSEASIVEVIDESCQKGEWG